MLAERKRLYYKLLGWAAAFILSLAMWCGIFLIFFILWFYS